MKDTLNAKVKHREMFRPFAPSVLEERADEYFDMKSRSPFMLLAPMVRPEQRSRIPAVVHVDGSARVQTVSASENPAFHELIQEFERLTDVPVLINTSFNDNGEPIVETPLDALICFLRTKMDYLFVDGLLVAKSDVQDAAGLLARLAEARRQALKDGYERAVTRLCPAYRGSELRAFLKQYHPMHRYYSHLHTLVLLQDTLSAWDAGAIYTDRYHYGIVERCLAEEHARLRERFVLVDDRYESRDIIKDYSLVVLFNLSLYLGDRNVTNFYKDLWVPILRPVLDRDTWEHDFDVSNEYQSSKDWDAFYTRVLKESQQ
jgi:hypothetical protein